MFHPLYLENNTAEMANKYILTPATLRNYYYYIYLQNYTFCTSVNIRI